MKSFAFQILAPLASLLFAAGCSSTPPSPSTNSAAITGAVESAPLQARSAVARFVTMTAPTDNGPPSTIHALTILISDKANDCAAFHAQGSTNLTITILGDAPGPGDYPIANAGTVAAKLGQADVDFDSVDQACKDKVAQPASTGSIAIKDVVINLTGPGDSIVSGSVDATFAGGHVTGDFDAILCPDVPSAVAAPPADAGAASAPTCAP